MTDSTIEAGVQARLDRLKELLGDEFPDLVPENDDHHAAPTVKHRDQVDGSDDYNPNLKVVVSGSETDSDPDTVHRPSTKKPAGPKRKSRRKKNNTNGQFTVPYRVNPDLQAFSPNYDHCGKLAPLEESFCPIQAVSKYPYKFVPSDIAESIADKFFNEGKFWNRSWDVYYIWPSVSVSAKPILLVPVAQFDKLLDEIYFAFDKSDQYFLTLGEEAKDFGLVAEFKDPHPDLRPRYMGCCASREAFVALEKGVPAPSYRPRDEPAPTYSVDPVAAQRHEQLMTLVFEIGKGKSKPGQKAGKKEKMQQNKRNWVNEMRRVERYLGFRPAIVQLQEPGQQASWDELQAYHAAKSSHRKLSAIDPSQPPPYNFDGLPVFVAIDVECWEKNKSLVTEVGLAMLDTAELNVLAPGEAGKNWHRFIKARHLRIQERTRLTNGVHVADASDNFMFPRDGSEFIPLEESTAAVRRCLEPPYCDIDRSTSAEEPSAAVDRSSGSTLVDSKEHQLDGVTPDNETSKRKLVIVGHHISQDILYLKHINIDLRSFDATIIDTCNLYKAHYHELNAKGLHTLAAGGDAHTIWHPHNAGNDAVYTIYAMINLVLEHTTERGSEEAKKRHEARQKQNQLDSVVIAGLTAKEVGEGWESEDEN